MEAHLSKMQTEIHDKDDEPHFETVKQRMPSSKEIKGLKLVIQK